MFVEIEFSLLPMHYSFFSFTVVKSAVAALTRIIVYKFCFYAMYIFQMQLQFEHAFVFFCFIYSQKSYTINLLLVFYLFIYILFIFINIFFYFLVDCLKL